ncbi:bifunctional riboflavin kinase/FAD synthetase [Clostridium sp. D2Q-14]|uniref:bifunctional riboflavin kinase/FAD synthetase n=1 Tax=Anaeromonas gelatinilytica TaxID=2683194 RepID=UPI00193C022D|nr:bifunctional riboflavin kinase/FAD synthetase [Anaeromonas gelatinilytica]MBS4536002.1 bifunctional riboflavin kinase/FAD synthetase [Anaeromonas gelatinilytica]
MRIIENINNKIEDETVICLGSFDGIHRGHKALIEDVIKESKEKGLKSLVFTFSNHPASIISDRNEPKLLINNDQKIKMFQKLGIDYLIMIPFSIEFMKVAPEKFVKNILIDNLNVKKIVVGFNYRFGYKGKGTTRLLEELGIKYEFKVDIVSPVKYKGDVVSSTTIRKLISEGNVRRASKFLDRYFSLEGKVIHGKKRGRSMGFPTVNIQLSSNYILPKKGVYETETIYNSHKYKSLTSISINPTFECERDISVETYILNFNKEIYSENIEINFIKYIRDIIKFKSKDELIKQLKLDVNSISN